MQESNLSDGHGGHGGPLLDHGSYGDMSYVLGIFPLNPIKSIISSYPSCFTDTFLWRHLTDLFKHLQASRILEVAR